MVFGKTARRGEIGMKTKQEEQLQTGSLKQERKDEAYEEYNKIGDTALNEYQKIKDTAWKEYKKKCKEIDAEEETACPICGK